MKRFFICGLVVTTLFLQGASEDDAIAPAEIQDHPTGSEYDHAILWKRYVRGKSVEAVDRCDIQAINDLLDAGVADIPYVSGEKSPYRRENMLYDALLHPEDASLEVVELLVRRGPM